MISGYRNNYNQQITKTGIKWKSKIRDELNYINYLLYGPFTVFKFELIVTIDHGYNIYA